MTHGPITVRHGDSREVLREFDADSFDSVVCDPPYALTSIVKRFGKPGSAPAKGNDAYMRASAGFMSQAWDNGSTAFDPDFWREVFRVMKPGAFVCAFGGTRSYHRLACAIEDAGFTTHPFVAWVFATGFPKATRVDAAGWEGWRYGTQALKPAIEPIFVGQKPFSEKTGTLNILRWGVGALNIDGCRIETFAESFADGCTAKHNDVYGKFNPADYDGSKGRWPANVCHDGSEEVLAAFPESEAGVRISEDHDSPGVTYALGRTGTTPRGHCDSGSAARFFYSAKADADDRLGSRHPTVKPVDLMQWLVRLVTPKNGLVLDCFAGSGSTGEAAFREGCRAVLIEREAAYVKDIERRIALLMAGPDERLRESVKASGRMSDPGPLFGGAVA